MKISKHITRCLPIVLAILAPFSASGLDAASVELKSGDTLSGEISAFDEETLTLLSQLSPEPLQINSQAIQRIVFPNNARNKGTHGERLTLLNGDTIPCQVHSLDDKQLHFSTWFGGDFTIPRSQVRGIRFGANEQRVIYGGTGRLEDWTTRRGAWTQADDGAFTCRGSGALARKFDLPRNLRISYTMAWKGTPNFAFRFCGENKSHSTKQDCYEFTFNSAGMQLRRYADGNTGAPLANPPLKPSQFRGRSVQLDFHVNRDVGKVTLFVDGTQVGSWPDTLEMSEGNYIIFNNRSSKNSLTFKNILVTDMHDGSLPRHREAIDKTKSDVLLDSTGDVYSGKILGIAKRNVKRFMRIKSDEDSKPFEVPEHRISALSFATAADIPEPPENTFAASFQAGGTIQLAEPKFAQGFVTANHPVLGQCKIDLRAIKQIKKLAPAKAKAQ